MPALYPGASMIAPSPRKVGAHTMPSKRGNFQERRVASVAITQSGENAVSSFFVRLSSFCQVAALFASSRSAGGSICDITGASGARVSHFGFGTPRAML